MGWMSDKLSSGWRGVALATLLILLTLILGAYSIVPTSNFPLALGRPFSLLLVLSFSPARWQRLSRWWASRSRDPTP